MALGEVLLTEDNARAVENKIRLHICKAFKADLALQTLQNKSLNCKCQG